MGLAARPGRGRPVARTLTDVGIDPKQADAITDAVRQAADHGDHVTPGDLRAEIGAVEARLYRFLMVQALGIIGATVAILRFVD